MQTIGYQPPPEKEELNNATKCADLAAVKSIFEKWRAEPKNELKSPDFFGTSLYPAVQGGHLAIAAYLIEHVTSVRQNNFYDANFGTAMKSFRTAMAMESYDFIELFLHHGSDINISWSESYLTPLAYTFHNEEMTRWFLDHGANPNAESRINKPLSPELYILLQ